jgi:DNA-3-methyladenine glycosylase I
MIPPVARTLPDVDVTIADDGLARCGWVGRDPEYLRYHDEEWGRPMHGDRALFEKITLEAFQSGLSWITILRRREGFRTAFASFDPAAIAAYDENDVARLLADTGIIRNRAKIDATISNAQALLALLAEEGEGALDRLIWDFAPPARPETDRPRALGDLPAITPESTALSKELKKRGFRFFGPTTAYALMQAGGLVDDHLTGCFRAAAH